MHEMGNGRILECEGLKKSYGDRVAVDGVGFVIARGETYGLLGPNGAGKTTTISMICGLLTRDAGAVIVDGKPMDTNSVDAKAAIGYVPQDLAIYPDLTGRENLNFFGQLYAIPRSDLKRRVEEILEVIGLADRANDVTDDYSGGMKRRLNIGIGLLHRPRLLVLDEPTVGVDPQSRNAILSSVEELSSAGMAVLYTTHYMEEAERLCDRVGVIDEGRIRAEGTRRELVSLVGQRDRVSLTATGNLAAAAATAAGLDAVPEATRGEEGINLIVTNARALLPQILETATRAGATVSAVEVVEPESRGGVLAPYGKGAQRLR
jgi:ABC-2 type transport system ATP-binding protein